MGVAINGKMRGLSGDENVLYLYCIGQHPGYAIVLTVLQDVPIRENQVKGTKGYICSLFYS